VIFNVLIVVRQVEAFARKSLKIAYIIISDYFNSGTNEIFFTLKRILLNSIGSDI